MSTHQPDMHQQKRAFDYANWLASYVWGWALVAVIVLALAAWALYRASEQANVPAPAPVQGPAVPSAEGTPVPQPSEPIETPLP